MITIILLLILMYMIYIDHKKVMMELEIIKASVTAPDKSDIMVKGTK